MCLSLSKSISVCLLTPFSPAHVYPLYTHMSFIVFALCQDTNIFRSLLVLADLSGSTKRVIRVMPCDLLAWNSLQQGSGRDFPAGTTVPQEHAKQSPTSPSFTPWQLASLHRPNQAEDWSRHLCQSQHAAWSRGIQMQGNGCIK